MKSIDELLKEAELAEEKARLAHLKYQNLEKKELITQHKKTEEVNQKLLDLEKIFNVKISDYNKYRRLSEIGFDSLKIIEVSSKIEDILNIKLNLTSLFQLKLIEFKELTTPGTSEYQEVIDKIDKIKNSSEVNDKHMDIEDDVGYCSFMLYHKMITDDEFKKLKKYQTQVSKGELGCQAIDDLNRFIEMSRTCVKNIENNDNHISYFKKELQIFKNNFQENVEKTHLAWCQFNSKIITYLDPELEEIPTDINDINVVFKYAT